MSNNKICVHNADDPILRQLEGYCVVATTSSREELRTAIGSGDAGVLVIDIDRPDAFDAIVEMLEVKPSLAIVGVTGTNDVNRCIKAQRAGCRQLTSKPLDEPDLLAAIRRASDKAAGASDALPLGKTVALIGTSGGAGTTTIACYLTMAFAESSNSPVGIIDLDLEFGTVAKAWDLGPRYTISDLAGVPEIEQQHIEDYFLEMPSGISVLPRPAQIDQVHSIDEGTVRKIISVSQNMFSHLVLDLPRKLDSITGAAIETCDKLLMVLQLTVPGIVNTLRLVEALVQFGVPSDKLEFVVNRHNKRMQHLDVDALEEKVAKKVIAVVPNHYRSVFAANDLGEPVAKGNPVRKAIADLAAKLSGRQAPPTQAGWMSSLGLRRNAIKP